MTNIINAVLNTLLVSIPEEFVWVVLTLIFLKRFDLLDTKRWQSNYKWFLIPTIPTAIMINVLRFIIPTTKGTSFIITTIIFYVLMIYIVRKNSVIEKTSILKIIITTILSSLIMLICELIYVPILLHMMGQSMTYVHQEIILNFLLSLPSRVFQVLLIMFLLYLTNSEVEINIFVNIIKDKMLLIYTTVFMMIILGLLYVIDKIACEYYILGYYSFYLQIFISLLLVMIPTVIIFTYLMPINYLIKSLKKNQKSHQNMLDDDFDINS